ncbi:hypothetical protein D1872_278870 [compost metagenome]
MFAGAAGSAFAASGAGCSGVVTGVSAGFGCGAAGDAGWATGLLPSAVTLSLNLA